MPVFPGNLAAKSSTQPSKIPVPSPRRLCLGGTTSSSSDSNTASFSPIPIVLKQIKQGAFELELASFLSQDFLQTPCLRYQWTCYFELWWP